jgi:RND family efflux transporter MFP subunit
MMFSLLFISCGKGNGDTPQKQEEKKLPLVKAQVLSTTTFKDIYKVTGVVKPYASAKVSSEISGLITSIKEKGTHVSRGQTVVSLKKDVDVATYNQSVAQVELARVNYEKQKELYEENATTEMQYLTAKWQLEAAERGLDVIRRRIWTGSITTPISGIVEDKYMNKGEMSNSGVPILSIIDISRVKISAGLPESYLTKIKLGQHVNITVDVIPGAEFDGTINYVAPSLDAQTRTFEIEVVINNPDRILKSGMNANVEISQFEKKDVIVIQQDIIIDNGDEQYVFVLEGDIAKKRVFKIGAREGNNVMIESGLNPGEKLITEGYQSLKDEEKVQEIQ